jgi:hypothetical protein
MTELKDHITEKLAALPEYDLCQVWDFVRYLEWRKARPDSDENLPSPYSPNRDRLIGLFDGPPDLASRAEDILQQAAAKYSGWTWKNNAA